jgi:enamine deaminase RidA (YjgF/YER057c/UK114 family)
VAPGLSPGISSPAARLAALGLELPPAAVLTTGTRFSYRRLVRAGSVAYLAGHLPAWGDELRYRGRVGAEVSPEAAVEAARLCALSMLRTVADELGSVNAIERWLRVTGFVRGIDGFDRQPAVLNGFTDLVRDLWGDDALPSRSAVGVAELPFGVCVEVDAMVQLGG